MDNPYEAPAEPPLLQPAEAGIPLWRWIAAAVILLPAVIAVASVVAFLLAGLLIALAFWDFRLDY